jgi:hypothetical protein
MSIEIARYQFHSWSRKGIANQIQEDDDLGAGGAGETERARIALPVKLNTKPTIDKKFDLIGPGDIIGVNRDMVVRTQPLNWITDFEPNYLPFIEFYNEDFAWSHTPASGVGDKLRPWLFLLVLKVGDDQVEAEFEPTNRRIPLPSINIKSNAVFPPVEETWLWAHVHNDSNIPDSELTTQEKFLISVNQNLNTDPDQLYCRLMSPRKLDKNTSYRAFLIPSFETGRLAGLGLPVKDIIAQKPSWTNGSGANGEMPYYYDWFFRTGENEDFESLIKRLKPVRMDPRVGIRDMDCIDPGFIKADGTKPFPPASPDILGLEGALKASDAISTVFPEPTDQFQGELQEIVNLPFKLIGTDTSGDPLISVPLYGGKHAKKSATDSIQPDVTNNTWVHDLNRDPRTRVGAGFGTLAVQKNQESFMQKAWAQVQTVIDANKHIKATLFFMNVALKYTQKTFNKVQPARLIAISRPVLSRIMGSPTTLYHQIKESRVPAAVFSGQFRRMTSVNSRMGKTYSGANKLEFEKLVTDINEGKITPAPPRVTPGGVFTTKDAADKIQPLQLPAWLEWIVQNRVLVLSLLLIAFLVLAFVTSAFFLFAGLAVVSVGLFIYSNKLSADKKVADELIDPQQQLDAIPAIPARPSFSLRISDETNPPLPTSTSPATDSVEATNFRNALTDSIKRLVVREPEKIVAPLALSNSWSKTKEGINPLKTFPKRLNALLKLPGNIVMDVPEKIFPAMAYPDIEDPMYKKLTDISDEAFLPNLKLIEFNTISLLVTNQKFIEAYMVGLNHEMGRELLWREYPTDERGSYFRQFWDVNGIISPTSPDGQITAAEKLKFKDITAIDTWKTTDLLGTHNNRQTENAHEEQVVLTIRGDLLKKYPNTIVFAQKAIPGTNGAESDIDKELSDADFRKKVKFPLYKAEVAPDIKFFGFDLTKEQASGTTASGTPPDTLGWYFVIMQAPGSPTFGMDINFNQGSDGLSWDDLSWESFGGEELKFIMKTKAPNINPADPVTKPTVWGADSASMAYILFQKPNMVAVHAKQMLPAGV